MHLSAAPTTRKLKPRAKAQLRPDAYPASPSPLNGERAGVRGVTEPTYDGLGWAMDTTATGDRIQHSGSNDTGFRCYCEFDRKRGTGLVIMANAVNGQRLWEEIMVAVGEP